jgi:hypothetical protein
MLRDLGGNVRIQFRMARGYNDKRYPTIQVWKNEDEK